MTPRIVRTLVYGGIALVALGFVLVVVAWAGVAGTADVWRQIPYVASGSIGGLAAVLVGLASLDMAVKLDGADRRSREFQALLAAVAGEAQGEVEAEAEIEGADEPARGVARFLTPVAAGYAIAAGALLAGIVGIGLAWWGTATTDVVREQLGYLVSGGVGGLALVAVGVGVAHVHTARWLTAGEAAALASATEQVDATGPR